MLDELWQPGEEAEQQRGLGRVRVVEQVERPDLGKVRMRRRQPVVGVELRAAHTAAREAHPACEGDVCRARLDGP